MIIESMLTTLFETIDDEYDTMIIVDRYGSLQHETSLDDALALSNGIYLSVLGGVVVQDSMTRESAEVYSGTEMIVERIDSISYCIMEDLQPDSDIGLL